MKTYYDESDYFDHAGSLNHYTDLFHSRFQKYRAQHLLKLYTPQSHETVLDMGCALGTLTFALAPYAKYVVGVDYSKKAITHAKRFLKTASFQNVTFVLTFADNPGLAAESFDVIFCADLLEHLYPDVSWKLLDEAYRLLKKDGKLVIWTPNRDHLFEVLKRRDLILKEDPSHVDYKKMQTLLSELKKRNFVICKAIYTESHIPFFKLLEKMLLPFVPLFRRRIAIVSEKT